MHQTHKFFEMMTKKSLRIHVRVTPETRVAWIRSCEKAGKKQSQVFRDLVDRFSDTINAGVESGEVETKQTET